MARAPGLEERHEAGAAHEDAAGVDGEREARGEVQGEGEEGDG